MSRLLVESPVSEGDIINVANGEYHYLSRVRRHKPGDIIFVKAGDAQYRARVVEISAAAAKIEILKEVESGAEPLPVNLLCAVPKGAAFDDVVRKVNEMGIARVTPFIAQRSDVIPGSNKLKRWKRIAKESCRQCGRLEPVEIFEPVSFKEAVYGLADWSLKIILHPHTENTVASRLLNEYSAAEGVVIAVGPEGGFTDFEIKMAEDNGFLKTKFGRYILRVETAALMASAAAVFFAGGLD
jgi:16S rRNA (uracil1498-N3)-methyltransferase